MHNTNTISEKLSTGRISLNLNRSLRARAMKVPFHRARLTDCKARDQDVETYQRERSSKNEQLRNDFNQLRDAS